MVSPEFRTLKSAEILVSHVRKHLRISGEACWCRGVSGIPWGDAPLRILDFRQASLRQGLKSRDLSGWLLVLLRTSLEAERQEPVGSRLLHEALYIAAVLSGKSWGYLGDYNDTLDFNGVLRFLRNLEEHLNALARKAGL